MNHRRGILLKFPPHRSLGRFVLLGNLREDNATNGEAARTRRIRELRVPFRHFDTHAPGNLQATCHLLGIKGSPHDAGRTLSVSVKIGRLKHGDLFALAREPVSRLIVLVVESFREVDFLDEFTRIESPDCTCPALLI